MQAEIANGNLLLQRMISQKYSGKPSIAFLQRVLTQFHSVWLQSKDLLQKEFQIQKWVINFNRKCLTDKSKSQRSGFLEAKQRGSTKNHNKPLYIIYCGRGANSSHYLILFGLVPRGKRIVVIFYLISFYWSGGFSFRMQQDSGIYPTNQWMI